MLPRFRLQTKITVAAVAAIVIPEKGLFNMTVERFLIERACARSDCSKRAMCRPYLRLSLLKFRFDVLQIPPSTFIFKTKFLSR